MRIIGIDPGVNGAAGVLTESGQFIEAFEMPTVLANKSSNRQMVNAHGLAAELRRVLADSDGNIMSIIEYVQPMKSDEPGAERRGMGASSAFAMGKSYGIIIAVLATLGISMETVMPAVWKKHFHLKRDKEQSRELAIRLFPGASMPFKKNHNRAEALLIARYFAETGGRKS